MVIYDSAAIYLESQPTALAKIAAINEIQAALLIAAVDAATKGNISEYMLNNGQTVIKTVYKNDKEIYDSYDRLEVLKQRLINQSVNGRMVRLSDQVNFIGRRRYGW